MGFFKSLFTGDNPTLSADEDQAGAISGVATGIGEGDATAASSYYRSLLSGDPSQVASTLAPEISAAQGRVGQQKKTGAEFGTRSGGTAASSAAASSGLDTDILNLEGNLKQGAASGAASLGTAEQGLGLQANQVQTQDSQLKMQNIMNSIFGSSISDGVAAAEAYATGGLSTLASKRKSKSSGGGSGDFDPSTDFGDSGGF